jgi:putative transposase
MPRKSRIDAPGALHHVIVRGINRQDIFLDHKDYSAFMGRLGDLLIETKTSCYAWALIPNHFHLLLRTGNVPISVLMKRLLTGYAVNYNRRHNRYGHLFQNRYKSILCQEDSYLLELVRYIHLNPLRATLVTEYKSLAGYPYCGHGAIMGRRKVEWQDTEYVLGLFGNKESGARGEYSRFVRNGIEQGSRPDLTGGGLLRSHGGWTGVKLLRETGDYQKGDERILGDGRFVKEVLSKAEEKFKKKYRLKAEGYDLKKLVKRVSEITGISSVQIFDSQRDKRRTDARSILCFWAKDELGMTQRELALELNLTPPAISHAVKRGRTLVEESSYSIESK